MGKRRPSRRGRGKRKIKAPIGLIVLIVILVILAVGVFGAWTTYTGSLKPIDSNNEDPIAVSVPDGSSTADIAKLLEENNLTKNALAFRIHSRLEENDGRYKAGDYELTQSMSMNEIMLALIQGTQAKTMRFTIAEGLTLKQTMERLVASEMVTEEEFMNEVVNGVFDYRFLESAPEGESRLEGFLYPETYEVVLDATTHDIIDVMLKQFDSKFTEEYYAKAAEEDMSVLEIVTMASLIERETGVDDERATVAGVIRNRLNIPMRLQIDATVQFALPEVKERLLYSDLEIDSPYNTYLNDGLPPGPICSPRIESIEAALYPEDHDYIYYVLQPDLKGRHNFSATYAEFERNKALYIEAIEARAAESN